MWEVVVAERTRNRVTTCGFREGNRKRKQKVSAVCYSESAIVKGSSSHFFLPFLPIELISCSLTLFCAFSLRGLWEILDETTLPCQRSRLFIESLTLLQEFSLYLSFLVLLRYVQLVTKVSSYVVLQGKSLSWKIFTRIFIEINCRIFKFSNFYHNFVFYIQSHLEIFFFFTTILISI